MVWILPIRQALPMRQGMFRTGRVSKFRRGALVVFGTVEPVRAPMAKACPLAQRVRPRRREG